MGHCAVPLLVFSCLLSIHPCSANTPCALQADLGEVQLLRLAHPGQPGSQMQWYTTERQAERVLCMGYNADVKKAWHPSEYIAMTAASSPILQKAQEELRAAQKGGKGGWAWGWEGSV